MAVVSISVAQRRAPILLVQHLAEDVGWSFLDGASFEPRNSLLITLGNALQLDPTIAEVKDLPLGWFAERSSIGASWVVQQDETTDEAS